jgi:diguanylate cyclase (GGDEF)-like protein
MRRARLFCEQGWDINGLSLLHEDVQRLTGASGTYGLLEVSEALLRFELILGDCLARETLPDAEASERIAELLGSLDKSLPARPPEPPKLRPVGASGHIAVARAEAPPAHYWRRWGQDAGQPSMPVEHEPPAVTPRSTEAPAAGPAADSAGEASSSMAADAARVAKVRRASGSAPVTQLARSTPQAAPNKRVSERLGRVYHLSDGSALACELDQKLESLGYELEILDDPEELCEVLTALPPDVVVVNAGFLGELEGVGTALRASRKRTGTRIPLLALAEEDSVQGRLSARRAGADAFLPGVGNADEVTQRLAELLAPEREEAYRILVVEDDRSQALFAESILRKAGMEVRVICEAMEVIGAIEAFKPDLILMDLYMPDVDGAELTSLIREREGDEATPIVFLSGEVDADKQLEALTAGGDDFLAKPIRPKHLIAAVSNRVRRSRALIRQGSSVMPDPRDRVTGLYRRSFVIERINEALAEESLRESDGGVLFLELDGAIALRERLGLTSLEQLLTEAAKQLCLNLREFDLAARYGEGSYFVLAPERNGADLEAMANMLRSSLMTHAFQAEGKPLRLRVIVGVCPLHYGFADAGAVLNTAERACREARREDSGVAVFAPRRGLGREQQAELLERLAHAIERDAFDLLYQPIVPLQGGDEAQYQTLVRLRDESGRIYTAAEIIPLAREAELVLDIDRWVMGHAMDVVARRQREQHPVRLFVSQSAQSLCTVDHADWIVAQLAEHGISGDLICVELPLSELDDEQEALLRFCQTLVRAGVHLCLSQFESSAVGVSLLEQLPIDFLKLSPRYLAAAATQSVRDELMIAIEQAHRRSISVIAHRVEDAQSAATLWIVGVDYMQGNMVQQAGDALDFDFQTAVL